MVCTHVLVDVMGPCRASKEALVRGRFNVHVIAKRGQMYGVLIIYSALTLLLNTGILLL